MFAREISCLSILSFETQMYLLSSRRQIHFKLQIYRSYHIEIIIFNSNLQFNLHLGSSKIEYQIKKIICPYFLILWYMSYIWSQVIPETSMIKGCWLAFLMFFLIQYHFYPFKMRLICVIVLCLISNWKTWNKSKLNDTAACNYIFHDLVI